MAQVSKEMANEKKLRFPQLSGLSQFSRQR